jgi:hypothetical protein
LYRWVGKAGTTPHFPFRKKGSRPGFSWFSGEVFAARLALKFNLKGSKDGSKRVIEAPLPVVGSSAVLVRNFYSFISAGTEGSMAAPIPFEEIYTLTLATFRILESLRSRQVVNLNLTMRAI